MRFNFIKAIIITALVSVLIVTTPSIVAAVERQFIYKLDYKTLVYENAKEYGLDEFLVFSVIKVESGFDSTAISNKGAMGLMQITPKTGEFIAEKLKIKDYNLLSPKTNVQFGCYYLRYLIDKFKSVQTAICAYNAGEGNVKAWLNKTEYSTDRINLIKVPFKETEEYREKIKKTFEKYNKLYENILDKNKNIE